MSQRGQHRPAQGRYRLGYNVVCGHMQPRVIMGPSRWSKHACTAALRQEVAPAQPYAILCQGACDKGCLGNPTRPCSLGPRPAESRRRRLASAPVALHGKWHGRNPVELHGRVGRWLCWSLLSSAAPAVAAAAGRVFMERGCRTETSAIVMPWGRATRMSPVGIVRCIEKLLIACASMNMDSCCRAR
jgi:hypothetical protein